VLEIFFTASNKSILSVVISTLSWGFDPLQLIQFITKGQIGSQTLNLYKKSSTQLPSHKSTFGFPNSHSSEAIARYEVLQMINPAGANSHIQTHINLFTCQITIYANTNRSQLDEKFYFTNR